MGSATRTAKKLADTVKIPGGQEVGKTLSGVIGTGLTSTPDTFDPSQSPLVDTAKKGLTDILTTDPNVSSNLQPTVSGETNLQPLPAPQLSEIQQRDSLQPVTPIEISGPGEVKLPAAEVARRKAFAGQISQRVRDAVASRGLNTSEAGAFIESEKISQFFQGLAETDFERARQLANENLQKNQEVISPEFWK